MPSMVPKEDAEFQSTRLGGGATAKRHNSALLFQGRFAQFIYIFNKAANVFQNWQMVFPGFPANYPCEPAPKTVGACGSLYQQAVLRVVAVLCSEMLNMVGIAIAQIVKAQTVTIFVHDFAQLGL